METPSTPAANPEIAKLDPSVLVERIKIQNPKIAESLNDKRLAGVVRQTLQALAAEINERKEGRFTIRGLGRITIREIERERNGETVKVKHVSLRPATPKA